ncbi:MAG: hypothetical protein ACXVJW_03090 [Acidimicrobiia bacterium]
MITTLTTTRTLHLVDIENLVGDPHATKAAALDALTRYVDLAGYVDGDHVVVAANPGLVAQIAFDLPVPCSPHAARGENGADLILLAQAEPGFVADRYDTAFTDAALAVRDRGIPVVVVSRAATLLGEGLGIRLLTEPMTLAA